ncbi:1-aminocyclopropane-1-carboxylate deaminase/D-cysteine desulfhydrase [Myroides odoratimimus]|uniref:1-aminocyclopropane-1-carboxylate deaminase/D-cysteine desulfhydrase n=1 Tax=Myroides odoratimimus TaxID=76832 RepID=UPI0010388886|nr:pyridoxal-phosphate dependent enzyme [Myroides odoratimimus]MCA4791746.1 1-aminocyclopropane-1-carboxylate deaminase/D-cysteine desulfhydrase [Myroides odoratimimus]MCA4805709.1 1-aminocyclopropane-1-carboxylate deaminase/D-cysteine desulfhydrase [Myroides odoratimimus]MCA4819007.1 1-aminocyclopropane-1-carboxylate deaminase/D-cysteine desulfhydrase [Myroides odoratimimus]MDM1059114.1 1-aminocyclopropane-1-carboxylate deaminase/D-cysteine desulfhydrase [Myroides odoratimimus]MDM1091798.1 1-
MFESENVYNEQLKVELPRGITIFVKREDLLHEEVSGNKFRKLKYNILKAQELGYSKLLTFGGAYSNHIAATAAAGRICGVETIGIIRGEELENNYAGNPTLTKAVEDGMTLGFMTRTEYRSKGEVEIIDRLKTRYGDFYLVPEGGTNAEAIKGTEEILKEGDEAFDYICTAVGTGGTIAGIINSSHQNQTILGFPALKGSFLYEDIRKFATNDNWDLVLDYHFGGYAKYNEELLSFLRELYRLTGVLFDPIYNGKMIYGVLEEIKKGRFKDNSKILVIHTGGLQGWNEKINI